MTRFRAWIVLGSVVIALGLASLGVALANRDYRRLDVAQPTSHRGTIPSDIQESMERRFNRGINPMPWWIVGSALLGTGVVVGGVAVRRRLA